MLLLATLPIVASAEDIPAPSPTDPHYDLEVLYHDRDFDTGLKLAKEQLAAHPDDTDLYWHVVRFMFEMGEKIPRTDKSFDKLAWYQEMIDLSNAGLAKKPGDPHLLFARGLSLGRYGTTRGVLSSLFLVDDVESDWLAAVNSGYSYRSLGNEEVMPCDVEDGLGIFYRLVPDSWIVEKLTGTKGDLAKSVDWLKKSDACMPGRIPVVKELGVAEICYGQRHDDEASVHQGMATLARAAGMAPSGPNDKVDLGHIAMLLGDPSQACAYSRDGQQDLDEKRLAKQGTSSPSAVE